MSHNEQEAAGSIRTFSRDDLGQVVLFMWREVLDAPKLEPGDNFFEHGGHSLLLLRLARQTRQSVGVTVPLRTFFTHPTAEQFSGHLFELLRSMRALD